MTSKPPSTIQTDSAKLALGSALAGLLAYAFVLIGSRSLGDEFAPITLLWSYWLLVNAVIAVPVQQWLVRSTAAGDAVAQLRKRLIRTAGWCIAAAGGAVVTTAVLREELFDSRSMVYPVCFGLMTVGVFLAGTARGMQASRGNYGWVGASLVGENAIRVVGAAAAALLDADPAVYAAVLPLGFIIALAPPSAIFGGLPNNATAPLSLLPTTTLRATVVTSVLPQLIWASPPFAATLVDAPDDRVTGIFLLVSLARLPNVIAMAVGLRILAWMTTVAGEGHDLRRMRSRIIAAAAMAVVPTAALAYGVGPQVLRLVFGAATDATRLQAALVAGGGVLGVVVLLVTLSLLAEGHAHIAMWAGLVAVTVGGVALVIAGGAPATRVAIAFTTAFAGYVTTMFIAGLRQPAKVGHP